MIILCFFYYVRFCQAKGNALRPCTHIKVIKEPRPDRNGLSCEIRVEWKPPGFNNNCIGIRNGKIVLINKKPRKVSFSSPDPI